MRWEGHVASMGKKIKVYKESQKEKDHLEDRDVDGRLGS
jgi:hypothetical protein